MSFQAVALDELFQVASGNAAPQNPNAFSPDGVPFVRAGSLGKLLAGAMEESLERLTLEAGKQHRLRLFPRDTILFAKSGMSALKGYIYQLEAPAFVVSHLAALVPTPKVHPRYARWALEVFSPTRLVKDPAYPSIRLPEIGKMEIPLPPLGEQRRIASILDQSQALRRKRRKVLAAQAELTRAYFQELFGNPLTNPMGWPVCRLGELGELERGVSKHRPRNDPTLLGGPYPLIQTGDVANADDVIETYSSTYTEKGLKQSLIWPKGTLCITIAANIGDAAILGFDACFPDSVVGFHPSDHVGIHYIQYLFKFLQQKLEQEAPEFAQKNINLAILRQIQAPVPPVELQNKFSSFVESQRSTKEKLKAQLAHLEALHASLQHRAFRGEL